MNFAISGSKSFVSMPGRHAALKMQINKTDQNDAEGLAQIVRTGWYRAVHVKSFDSHRARASLELEGLGTRDRQAIGEWQSPGDRTLGA
jgi:transposase